MTKKRLWLILIVVFLLISYLGIIALARKNNKFCGGIAANLPEFQCPSGYVCKLEGNYPDAGGRCVFILDAPTLLF